MFATPAFCYQDHLPRPTPSCKIWPKKMKKNKFLWRVHLTKKWCLFFFSWLLCSCVTMRLTEWKLRPIFLNLLSSIWRVRICSKMFFFFLLDESVERLIKRIIYSCFDFPFMICALFSFFGVLILYFSAYFVFYNRAVYNGHNVFIIFTVNAAFSCSWTSVTDYLWRSCFHPRSTMFLA